MKKLIMFLSGIVILAITVTSHATPAPFACPAAEDVYAWLLAAPYSPQTGREATVYLTQDGLTNTYWYAHSSQYVNPLPDGLQFGYISGQWSTSGAPTMTCNYVAISSSTTPPDLTSASIKASVQWEWNGSDPFDNPYPSNKYVYKLDGLSIRYSAGYATCENNSADPSNTCKIQVLDNTASSAKKE